MKERYFFTIIALIALIFFISNKQITAQEDTLVVQWETEPGSGIPLEDALRNAILGDTVAGGARANENRVYKLLRGGLYWNQNRIENNGFHLRIVGEPGDPNVDFANGGNPPVIQMVARDDNSYDGRILTGLDDITLKNLYIIGARDNGVQTDYQPMQIDASNSRFEIDNVIFERTNFALMAFTGNTNVIIFKNCKFRNLIGRPSTQQWEGRGISIWADQDSVIVENCTFFNIEFTSFQLEGGAAKYLRFNHNTLVNIGRQAAIAGSSWREAYFANNLIVNGWWHGEGPGDYNAAGRVGYTSGLFGIGDMPAKYGAEEGRRILFANMAYYLDPRFTAYYGDTIRSQYYVNEITTEDYLDVYDQMSANDTMWLSTPPNFSTIFSDEQINLMISNINMLRSGQTPATDFYYMYPQLEAGGECYQCASWPLPENFAYTNSEIITASTEGLPLGDLNWFPAQKTTFESNLEQYVEAMQSEAGNIVIYEPKGDYQAESGTLSNGATIDEFTGFSYFIMDGAGWFQWDFNMDAPATIDLKAYTNMRGNNPRGQRHIINGISIHDSTFGYGELIYSADSGAFAGKPLNDWTDVTWTKEHLKVADRPAFDLVAGNNTLRIEPSWGYQNFHGFDILAAGTSTVLHELRVNNSTSETVGLGGLGAPWVPQELKSVALGTNGTTTLTINIPEAGDYKLQIYFQNVSGSVQSGQLVVDGGTPIPLSFDFNTDSTGLGVLSDRFSLTAGDHSFAITGSNIKVDYVQPNKETIVLGLGRNDGLVTDYKLEQNYPNPFNPTTNIKFSIAKSSVVRLTIYNILGQRVATLLNNFLNAGSYTYEFNASHLASGVYFYSLEAGDFKVSKKMMLLK